MCIYILPDQKAIIAGWPQFDDIREGFWIKFWTSGSAPTGKRVKVKVHVFWLGHFARSKIEYESIFLIKYYINTILIFFEAFRPLFNKVKNGFPIVFLNLQRKGFVFFFKLGSKCLDFVITT